MVGSETEEEKKRMASDGISETKKQQTDTDIVVVFPPNSSKVGNITEDLSFVYVFCLETKPSTDDEDEDGKPCVMYSYPRNGNILLGAEGIFVVLYHVMKDLTSQPAETTVLTLDKGESLWVKYHKEGQKIMVLVVRSLISYSETITSLFQSVVRLIQILYGSIENAFTHKKYHNKLNKIFSSIEKKINESPSTKSNHHPVLNPGFEYIPFFTLPTSVQNNLDDVLSDLESGNFSNKEFKDISYYHQKPDTLIGSCLFTNGYLLCSHLPAKHLEDVHLYLKFNQLLDRQVVKESRQIILWREIYPTEFEIQKEAALGYPEQPTCCFLLVLASENKLLCILLQSSSSALTELSKSTPPPFYIEQLKVSLLKVESIIQDFTEKSGFDTEGKPQTYSNISFTDQITSLLKLPSKHTLPTPSEHVHSSFNESSINLEMLNLTLSPSSRDSAFENSEKVVQNLSSRLYSTFPTSPNSSQNELHARNETSFPDNSTGYMTKQRSAKGQLTSDVMHKGPSYTNLISIQHLTPSYFGIAAILYLQTSKDQMLTGVRINGSFTVSSTLMSQFNRCCTIIKEHLGATKWSNPQFSKKSTKLPSGMARTNISCGINEYGILLQQQELKGLKMKDTQKIDYWVIGRQVCRGRHLKQLVFVCFQDSMPQNLVELAFCIPFGHNWTE